MQARIIPELEAAKLKVELEKIFILIEEGLKNNNTTLIITHLYTLHTFIHKNIQPYYGKGKLLPLKVPVYDFDIAALNDLFAKELTGFKKKYDNTTLRNAGILLEALQTGLCNAAVREDALTVTNFALVKSMLELFASVTNNDFFLVDLNLEKDVDPLVETLKINEILKNVQGNIFSFFYHPVALMQTAYRQYVAPIPGVISAKFSRQ